MLMPSFSPASFLIQSSYKNNVGNPEEAESEGVYHPMANELHYLRDCADFLHVELSYT
jgi:hypothetical protein